MGFLDFYTPQYKRRFSHQKKEKKKIHNTFLNHPRHFSQLNQGGCIFCHQSINHIAAVIAEVRASFGIK
jgi:radical SAM superfamily enzyme